MYLPEKFERKMQDILGDEYQEYVDCYEAPRYYGLRVNTKKISVEDFVRICPSVRYHGLRMDFITMEHRSRRQSIHIMQRDYIICRSQVL